MLHKCNVSANMWFFLKYLFCFKCMFCTEAWVARCGPCCGGCLKYIGCKVFWPTRCPAPGLFSWCIASSHIHSARQGGKCLCMALYSHPPDLSKWANLIFCPSFQRYDFCVLLFPLPFSKLFFLLLFFSPNLFLACLSFLLLNVIVSLNILELCVGPPKWNSSMTLRVAICGSFAT